ncbi:hypothetical protein BSKO_10297 [Bryopsis sp. KO-2023]|nr:hypothetical protein BSKO_10297 [Bryopsis sp. KO-2023]
MAKLIALLTALLFVSCHGKVSTTDPLEPEGEDLEHVYSSCASFPGKYTLKLQSIVKIVYLNALPHPLMLTRYPSLNEFPVGSLFGAAVILFSDSTATPPSIQDIELSNPHGSILGVNLFEGNCRVVVDFVIPGKCYDGCLPGGACVGIRGGAIKEAGELHRFFPPKSDCKLLDAKDRPHCVKAKLYAVDMGLSKSGVPFTNKKDASLVLSFTAPLHRSPSFTGHDFHIYGPKGTYIKSITDNHGAFKLKIHHAHIYQAARIKVCFLGGKKLKRFGIPYIGKSDVCIDYIQSTTEPVVTSVGFKIDNTHSLHTEVCPIVHAVRPSQPNPEADEKAKDFWGYADGGVWWIPGENAKVTFLNSGAESSSLEGSVKTAFYELEQDGEVKALDQEISLPPELTHLLSDLSSGDEQHKKVYKLLPQIYEALDKDALIAALEVLNADGTINIPRAVGIIRYVGLDENHVQRFEDIVAKHYGSLDSDQILHAFGITDRYGRLSSAKIFMHLLSRLPKNFDIETILNDNAPPDANLVNKRHNLKAKISGPDGTLFKGNVDAHNAGRVVERFVEKHRFQPSKESLRHPHHLYL